MTGAAPLDKDTTLPREEELPSTRDSSPPGITALAGSDLTRPDKQAASRAAQAPSQLSQRRAGIRRRNARQEHMRAAALPW